MRLIFRTITCLALTFGLAFATGPVNDACSGALVIQPGKSYHQLNNADATLGPAGETPDGIPITCIQSFENDLWYTFTTTAEFSRYRITIVHEQCSTPAGLQALLIESADCDRKHFTYRGCSNLQSDTDTIKMVLDEKNAGKKIFLHVDGYDGTQCSFTIIFEGLSESVVTPNQLKYLQTDYTPSTEQTFTPPGLFTKSENNLFTVTWSAPANDDAVTYILERLYNSDGHGAYGKVLYYIDPQGAVTGGTVTYTITDFKSKNPPGINPICYRLVKYDGQSLYYTKPFCQDVYVNPTLYVTVDFKLDEAQKLHVPYQIKKKQDLTFILLDAFQKELKRLTLPKVAEGLNEVTISMSDYPTGLYYVQVIGADGEFKRPFQFLKP